MKTLDNIILRTLALRNWSTLQIVANLFTFFLSTYYFDSNTMFANIIVTGFFIIWCLISLSKSIKNRTFSFHPYLLEQKLPECFIAICFMSFCTVKSLVFIKVVSAFQYVATHEKENVITGLTENLWSIIFIGVLAILFVALGISKQADSMENSSSNVQIDYLKSKYNLDLDKTYFFLMGNKIIGFLVGKYKFDIVDGLKVGKRYYKPSIVLEYFNITGIGFHDLNDGHVKNIEMYGISGQ